ncbi:MAG: segregation and condensation protein [Patescibacteria group bacterium]|nr:segregation and condensation protein [Patescibacteria group bacterium]
MNNLEQKIEAILFFKGEPVSLKKLTDILKVSGEEVKDAILNLKENLQNRGIVLLEKDDEITLGTAPELSEMIENLQKEELSKDLSKATLETLSIVLYKNGATRAEIDYIRGVNSTFSLRALSVRGLVEKIQDPSDNRRFIYKPTFELLSFMGVTKVEELPEYETTLMTINQTIKNSEENV